MVEVNKVRFLQHPEMDEYVEQHGDQVFRLVPESYINSKNLYENKYGYATLNRVSQKRFTRHEVLQDTAFNQNPQMRLKNVLPRDLCEIFIQQYKNSSASVYHPDFMNALLPLILTPEIDSLICSHFRSEYCLFWYSYLETPTDRVNRSLSSHWHCDGGPEKHLKMLIYLNDYQEHFGNTKFYDKATTDRLKEIGYIFGAVKHRSDDLELLAAAKGIELSETMYEDIEAGDALLFNPEQIAHIGKIPELASRHVLQLCFLPSPAHWQFTKEHILPTQTRCMDFANAAQQILDTIHRKIENKIKPIKINADGTITQPEQLKYLLDNIFTEGPYAQITYDKLLALDPEFKRLNNVAALIATLKNTFENNIDWQGRLGIDNIKALVMLVQYERDIKDNYGRYAAQGKPDPTAVFWPSPLHPDQPRSKYDLLPFVQKHPIVYRHTPIGSAGSCFAFEIARVFQQKGFNYVVAERNDDVTAGVIVDGYQPGDQQVKFCANYGILFNTPSFRQLAEKAFGVKMTPPLLFAQADGTWVDPYRENVTFRSKDAYIIDYDQHIQACRTTLERCEVFVITLGLNECWQFQDGTVLSRNPRGNMYPLVTHKTLTVAENVENIQTFFNIIKRHNPQFKLIISVSPIPFLATGLGSQKHIISANTHSKATLRVAAEQLVADNEDIYYLPSYELVTECIKDPWSDDERHVKASTVEKVVELFQTMFTRAGA